VGKIWTNSSQQSEETAENCENAGVVLMASPISILPFSWTLWILFTVITLVSLIIAGYSRTVNDMMLRALSLVTSIGMIVVSVTPQRYYFFYDNSTVKTITQTLVFTDILAEFWIIMSMMFASICATMLVITALPEEGEGNA